MIGSRDPKYTRPCHNDTMIYKPFSYKKGAVIHSPFGLRWELYYLKEWLHTHNNKDYVIQLEGNNILVNGKKTLAVSFPVKYRSLIDLYKYLST